MKGWVGKILLIDLGSGQVTTVPTERYAQKYVGGRGIATKLAYDLIPPGTDPLGPENALALIPGVFTGTAVPSAARVDVVTKSPVTNLLGGSSTGGFWGPELKFAGYDGLVVKGRAAKPVYILIRDDEVQIKDAGDLWGLTIPQTDEAIRARERDGDIKVACIGPAGEKMVNFAGLSFSMRNMAARGGIGAVAGAKNLKAIAVRGTRWIEAAHPQKLLALCKAIQDKELALPQYERGPTWYYGVFKALVSNGRPFYGNCDDVPWEGRTRAFEEAKKFIAAAELKLESCFGCPLRCWGRISVPEIGATQMIACQGTISALVFYLKTLDFDTVWRIMLACQEQGLDSMSTGAVLAFATDLYERGIITADGLGFDLAWDSPNVLELLDLIVKREGLGDTFALGIKGAAERIGGEALKRAAYGKGGMEFWSTEMRPFKGHALGASVTETGNSSRAVHHFPESSALSKPEKARKVAKKVTGSEEAGDPRSYVGKPALVRHFEDLHILSDVFGICDTPYIAIDPNLWREAFTLLTDVPYTDDDMKALGERVRTLERMFNVREGLTRKDDRLSDRMFEEPIKGGDWDGEVLDRAKFEAMLDEYYALRGWDDNGIPTPETLERMGL